MKKRRMHASPSFPMNAGALDASMGCAPSQPWAIVPDMLSMILGLKRPSAATNVDTPAKVDVGKLFEEHAPFLLRCVERMTGPGSHVEDIVQEVFLTAHV